MKNEILLRTLGEIDDDLIEEDAHTTKPFRLLRLIACAAAVVLLATVAVTTFGRPTLPVDTPTTTTTDALTTTNNNLPEVGTTTKQASHKTTTGKRATENATTTSPESTTTTRVTTTARGPEIAIIPHWEDKTLSQQFPEATFGNVTYSVLSPAVVIDAAADRLNSALSVLRIMYQSLPRKL